MASDDSEMCIQCAVPHQFTMKLAAGSDTRRPKGVNGAMRLGEITGRAWMPDPGTPAAASGNLTRISHKSGVRRSCE